MKKCSITIRFWMQLFVFLLSGYFSNGILAQKFDKISPELLEISENKEKGQSLKNSNIKNETWVSGKESMIQIIEDKYVVVDAISKGNNAKLLEELKELGLTKSCSFGGMVSGLLPLESIKSLESLSSLKYVNVAYKPVYNSGEALSQGVKALKANTVVKRLGVDGSGVVIGTLSDSYNKLGGANKGIRDGELPGRNNPNGFTKRIDVLEESVRGGADEGRAMMEIIHDVAPGAELKFHTSFLGTASFAQGIINLAKAGCDIINDDAFLYNEPFFQDGPVAQAVNKAVNKHGVSYFTLAGNFGQNSYRSDFNPGVTASVGASGQPAYGQYLLHDFDPSQGENYFQEVRIPAKGRVVISLQWDEPFASVCEGCPGAESNIDIFFATARNTSSVVRSSRIQNIGNDAFEVLNVVSNRDEPSTAYIIIGQKVESAQTVPMDGVIKYISFGNGVPQGLTPNEPTCYGHCNAAKAVTIGSSAFFNTPQYGQRTPIINPSSSKGGIPILFDTKGKRFGKPKYRKKPDLVAVDGGNNSFFGNDSERDDDNLPNFFGTSAATPHAAGVMALLKEIAGNKLSNNELHNILKSTAIDMDDPDTRGSDRGFDYKTGYGLIQAFAAAQNVKRAIANRVTTSQRSLDAATPLEYSVYPNPVVNNANVKFVSESPEKLIVKVYNFSGKTVLTKNCNVVEGVNNIKINLQQLSKGIYYMSLQSEDGKELGTQKISKR